MFSFVINHFSPSITSSHLRLSAAFGASLALRDPLVAEVILIDGSAAPDPQLEAMITDMGGHYTHAGRALTFSEGYNEGLRLARSPWIALSASDVYLSSTFLTESAQIVRALGSQVGCIVPRLTLSALPAQMTRRRKHRTAELPLMTINLNVFETAYLRDIGGVPTIFSGNYNDVLLSHRLATDSRAIIMTTSTCAHYGSLTLASGGSSASLAGVITLWRERFASLRHDRALWEVDIAKFMSRGPRRVTIRVANRLLPRAAARMVSSALMTRFTHSTPRQATD